MTREKLGEVRQLLEDSLSKEEFLDLFTKVIDFVKALEPKLLEKVDFRVADVQEQLLESLRNDFSKLSDETKNRDKESLNKIESAIKELVADTISKTQEKLKQVDDKISQIKDAKDGKDADEEMIIAKVLKQVPVPTFDDSKLQDIKDELIDELRKNKRVGGGFSKIHFESAYPGTDGQVLTRQADGSWAAENAGAGSGDVAGPSSSTDNAIVRFDGTTGKLIQDYSSGAPTISDSGSVVLATGTSLSIGSTVFMFAPGTSSGYLAGSGNASSTATSSLGMGYNALHAIETNGFNTAVGNQALELDTSGGANTGIGFKALNANIIGNGLIGIGANAGRYATADNEFYVNSINRSNTAGDKAKSLLYGVMATDETTQTLVTNSAFTATYGMNIPTGQTYKINSVDIFTSPTLTTPNLGVATATSINKVTITAPTTSATLTLIDGSSLITAGAFATTLTSTATTNVTLPTTGTLATLAGTETLTNKTLTAPKFADLGFIADSRGDEMLQFDEAATTASNFLRVVNSVAGSGPQLVADGSDTNVTLKLFAKGSGTIEINTGFNVGSNRLYLTGGGLGIVDSGANEYIKFVQVSTARNEFTITNAVDGTGPTLSTTGSSDTNIDMNLSPKGAGRVVINSELNMGAHAVGFTQQTATGDGTTTIDWKLGPKFYFTFGNANETFTFTAPTGVCSMTLVMKQYSTGGKTATWPASVKWPGGVAPTLSTGNNAIDIVSFYFDGTSYFGSSSLNFS